MSKLFWNFQPSLGWASEEICHLTKASNQCLEMIKLLHEWRSGTAAKVQNKRSVFLLKSKETCLREIFSDDVTIWRVTIQIYFSEHMRKRPFILDLRCTNVYTVFFQSSSFRYDSDMIVGTLSCVTIRRRNILGVSKQNHKRRDDGKDWRRNRRAATRKGFRIYNTKTYTPDGFLWFLFFLFLGGLVGFILGEV